MTLTELAQQNLGGRDLLEKSPQGLARGPIKSVSMVGANLEIRRQWVAVSFDAGSSWEEVTQHTDALIGKIAVVEKGDADEINITIPITSWTILPPGDNLTRP